MMLKISPLLALGVLLSVLGSAWACDTPVYEYTLVMWQRDPYEVVYFHRGGEDPKDKQINAYLDNVTRGKGSNANVVFTRADVSALEKGEGRRLARQVWEWHKDRALPFHVVLTPRGSELLVGRLDLATFKSMADSPKRKEVAKQLCGRKRGLLILMTGPDAAENASARKTLRKVIDEGKAEGVEIGFVEVSRSDATEKWLVEQLLNLEDDLKEIPRPMVFGTFGRAHVLEPFLGRGITHENMLDLVAFMNGPCSCEIKAMSPGMDLLTNWDWEAQVADWPLDEGLVAAEPVGTAPDSPPTPEPPAAKSTSTGGKADGKRLARVAGTPAGSRKEAPRESSATSAPSPASPKTASSSKAKPSRSSGGPVLPKAAAPLSGKTEKTGTQPAAAGESPAGEEARGPELPPPNATPAPPSIETGRGFNADLAMGLGLGMGGAAILAAAVGFVVVLRRREE